MDFSIEEREPYIDREKIKEFLDELTYPLYFLDFETMQLVVPGFDRSHPYDQITFQYSLHYIGSENGELKHKEFLGVSGEDPRRALAESLCHDIPDNVCVLAYNKAFECTRIEELRESFYADAQLYLGSMNASHIATNDKSSSVRNVEFMVRLTCKKRSLNLAMLSV